MPLVLDHQDQIHTHVDPGRRVRRTEAVVAALREAVPGTDDHSQLTQELISANLSMARMLAVRYRNRGIDLDDLQQVAMLGLTKAARRFDPHAGHDFMSYAVPTIRGELRRHFRDAGWMVRPPRRVQELQARIGQAQTTLENRLRRSPRPSELADHLGVDLDDVVEALTADGCFMPTSLDGTVGDGPLTIGDMLGSEDRSLRSVEARVVLKPVIQRLSERDRRILYLRFYEERSQQEIADDVGLTQAQVSRVLARLMDDLRHDLEAPHAVA